MKDQFWDDLYPELPYTAAAEETRTDPVIGGTANYEVPEDEAEFLPMSGNFDEDNEEDQPIKIKKNDSSLFVKNGINLDKPINDDVETGSFINIVAGGKPNKQPINIIKNSYRTSEFGSLLSVDKPPRPLQKSSANSASGATLVSRLATIIG